MKKSIIIILLSLTFLAAKDSRGGKDLIPVVLRDTTDYYHGPDYYEYFSFINRKDSAAFYSFVDDIYRKQMLFQDTVTVLCNGEPHYSRTIIKEKGKKVKWVQYDSKSRETFVVTYKRDGSIYRTVNYSYDKEGRRITGSGVNPFTEYYQWGIQHPTTFDAAHPTGFTISSLNLHFEIPTPHIANVYRPIIVIANEAGVNGYACRLGLSPFITKECYGGSSLFSFTPITVNASFTYLYRDDEYNKIPEPVPYRWYVGADADLNFIFGHFRLGAYRLIGPEEDRPWRFLFSIGASPAILAVPFAAH